MVLSKGKIVKKQICGVAKKDIKLCLNFLQLYLLLY